MPSSLSFLDQQNAQELLEAIQYFSRKGWSPATSTNYSIRLGNPDQFLISRSGVDKSRFVASDLIVIDGKGSVAPISQGPGIKSSAETEIHTAIYQRFPEVQCVLHTHSPLGTYLSQKFVKAWEIKFSDWEILKGLAGITTHLTTVVLPVVNNHQDMPSILNEMDPHWHNNPHGFLIAGHGLYTWGKSVAEAKRHIETFEFLFELKNFGEE
jgi:methylthioribulose-1-phosphate dehydratase